MNVGQKALSENALVKFGLLPGAGGGMVGTAYGVNDKINNPYADRNTISESAMTGTLVGLAAGGISASSFRGFRDFQIKQSVYTNASSPMTQAQRMVLGS